MKDIALHIMDIVQNSISAGATVVYIEVVENISKDQFSLVIRDNGPGMDKEMLKRITDPYFTTRTTRKVGLGIPLLKHSSEQAGGSFTLGSVRGEGTKVTAIFGHSHIDRPPKGDIAGVISILAGSNPEMDFIYQHTINDADYILDTREVKKILDDIPLSEPSVIRYLREMIEENIKVMEQ